jgi:hypothetical protein
MNHADRLRRVRKIVRVMAHIADGQCADPGQTDVPSRPPSLSAEEDAVDVTELKNRVLRMVRYFFDPQRKPIEVEQ